MGTVGGNASSFGVLVAAILGLLCGMLRGAALHSALDVQAAGNVEMESHSMPLECQTMAKMRFVGLWTKAWTHFLNANELAMGARWLGTALPRPKEWR